MFGRLGRVAGSIFVDGPEEHELPVRRGVGDARRGGRGRAARRSRRRSRGAGRRMPAGRLAPAGSRAGAKCAESTLLGKGWTFGWRATLGLVEAVAAGEARDRPGRRARSRARAALGARPRKPRARPCSRTRRPSGEMLRAKGTRHRRVEPEHERLDTVVAEEPSSNASCMGTTVVLGDSRDGSCGRRRCKPLVHRFDVAAAVSPLARRRAPRRRRRAVPGRSGSEAAAGAARRSSSAGARRRRGRSRSQARLVSAWYEVTHAC